MFEMIRDGGIYTGRTHQLLSLFGEAYTKIGTIQRRLAWPLCKDDTQNLRSVQIFFL